MIQTAIERIDGLVGDYKKARADGDLDRACRLGALAVQQSKDELAKLSTSQADRSYYESVISNITPFLANPTPPPKATKPLGGGTEDKIKSTNWFSAKAPDLKLSDIAGLKELKEQFIVNIIAPTLPQFSAVYKKYRGSERGLQVLLYGPPGTGKTFAVRCLAGELGCAIAVVQIKDVMANLVGDGAKIIAEIFEQANKYDKCIIFFDEIDAIASSREGDDSRHTKEQLTTLLTYMDGFTSKANPDQLRIVIAATNRPWALDSAVKRGGRFDTQILVPMPDYDARCQLVRLALGKDEKVKKRVDVPCAGDVTVDWVADRLDGYAGADIKSICRQAASKPLKRELLALIAGKQKPDMITRDDFETVFSSYINSVTDNDLMQYDAYSMNMEYGDDYIVTKLEYLVKALYSRVKLAGYEARLAKRFWDDGTVTELFGKKYDLSHMSERLAEIFKD